VPTSADRTRSQLERADAILEAFDAQHDSLSLQGLVQRTALPKTTVHRTVKKMLEFGWLECFDGRYTIGTRLFERAALAARPMALRDAAQRPMHGLRAATLETVHLGVLDGAQVVYLEKLVGHRPVRTSSRVGGRLPALCTALGKVLTAYRPEVPGSRIETPVPRTPHTLTDPDDIRRMLAEARRDGVGHDREETDPGVHCIAAPVTAPDGACVAALSVTGPAGRLDFPRLAPMVSSAARQASLLFAARSPTPTRWSPRSCPTAAGGGTADRGSRPRPSSAGPPVRQPRAEC
jgi:DNA-binding IclR family transcriptional regulator